jgi:hypothetical protein
LTYIHFSAAAMASNGETPVHKDFLDDLPDFHKSPARTSGHGQSHSRNPSTSSLGDLTMLELDRNEEDVVEIIVNEHVDEQPKIPKSTLVVVTESENVAGHDRMVSLGGDVSLSNLDFSLEKFRCRDWDGKRGYVRA